MLDIRPVTRVIAVCNSCERESNPVDFVDDIEPEDHMKNMGEAFAKIMWNVTADGAWCPDCKGLPR